MDFNMLGCHFEVPLVLTSQVLNTILRYVYSLEPYKYILTRMVSNEIGDKLKLRHGFK